ncbi:MAG: phosphatase domain-containing protein [Polyangiales bacterium]
MIGERLLVLRAFGVAFGDNVVLRGLGLTLDACGVMTLMGPGGAGKSTLLRTIAGHNDAQPLLRTWGTAHYEGRPLGTGPRPFLVAQSARLMIATVVENVAIGFPDRHLLTQRQQRDRVRALLDEIGLVWLAERLDARVLDLPIGAQRVLAVARAVASEARMVLLDEPCVGLAEDEREMLVELVRREATQRAFLVVTHNRNDALDVGGRIALLCGGRVVEESETAAFFAGPVSAAGRHFVETGTCYLDPVELELGEPHLDDDAVDTPRTPTSSIATARPPVSARVSMPRPPRGLHWVKRGQLAGLPRPGLLVDVEEDVNGLYSLGIGTLVTLEETRTVPEDLLERHSIESLWWPIPDMGAPSLEEADRLCAAIAARIVAGVAVAVHCRAGLGRTGTILASYLIAEGHSALEALERIRCLQPRFVQSDEQIEFLTEFARHRATTS